MKDLLFEIRGKDKTQAAFDSARRNARGFGNEMDEVGRGMALAAGAAKAFIAGIGIGVITEAGAAMRELVAQAGELVDTADRLGLSTENLQRFQFGLEQAGLTSGEVVGSLEQWNRRLGEAHVTGGRLAEVLEANNVQLTDGNGQLRSSVDLLREYAGLIQNAASDQERAVLAQIAFGMWGEDMVNALRDGAAGFDEIMRAADDAGGVIEDEVLRRAAEVDDEFERVARTIETRVKSALLEVVGIVGDMQSEAAGFVDQLMQFNPDMFRRLGLMTGVVDPRRQGLVTDPDGGRVRPRTMDDAQAQFNDAFAMWAQRQRDTPARTIIPDNDDGPRRSRSAGAAREQVSAYQRVIEKLEEERAAIGLNETEQRILHEQRRAGVTATSEQGKAIAALVTELEAEEERLQRVKEEQRAYNEAIEEIGGGALDAVFAWADGAQTAEEAAKRLGMEILKAVTYGALLGTGPFGAFFGGGGGSSLGGLIGMFFGAPAADPYAGYTAPTSAAMAAVTGAADAPGRVEGLHITVGLASDGALNIMPEVRGVAQGEAAVAAGKVAKAVPSMVDQRTDERQVRRIRPAGSV